MEAMVVIDIGLLCAGLPVAESGRKPHLFALLSDFILLRGWIMALLFAILLL
jgi:hypothetical protein